MVRPYLGLMTIDGINNLDEKRIFVMCLKTPDTVNYMKIPYTFLKSDILICLGAAQEADT